DTLQRINSRSGAQSVISSGGLFQTPDGVAVAANGDIYVADRTAGIIRVNPTSGVQTLVSSGGSFATLFAIAVAPNGALFLTDDSAFAGAGAVFKVNPTTGVQTVIGSSPAGEVPGGIT